MRLLARKYGIEVEEERGTEEAGRHEARQAILRGNEDFARSLLPYDPAEGITGKDENGEEDRRALREAFFPLRGRYLPARRPRGLQALPEAACLPGKDHRGTDSGFAGGTGERRGREQPNTSTPTTARRTTRDVSSTACTRR